MKTGLFLSATWLASSWLIAEDSNIVENHWVWRNGELVLIPKMNMSPLTEAVASSNTQDVQWTLSGGKVKKDVSTSPVSAVPKEKFDPYLGDVPAASPGYLQPTPFRSHKSLDDQSIPMPFSHGELPPRKDIDSDITPKVKIKSLSAKASERDLTVAEIKAWGRALEAKAKELKKLEFKLKDSEDPFKFKEYLDQSQKQKQDLAQYRLQIAKKKK